MQRTKTILFGLMLLGSGAAALAEEPVVRIATEGAFPPYSFMAPDGTLGGFDVDIANALCIVMKTRCEIVKQEWDGLIPGLLAKKYDAIVSSMNITPARQQKVAFSDKYEGGYSMLFGGQSLADSSPAALQGKVIAVQKGTVQESFAKDYYEKAGLSLRSYPDIATAKMDLTAGRVDALLMDVGNIYEARKDPSLSEYSAFGEKFKDPAYFGAGSGIALRKNDVVLLGKINQALAEILANGTYKQINDKYFNYNQYE
ncbi:transporter substrate-binding domain-containing protein [Pseudomonas putida]|uniref:transporter substrate-binding domain-containing protein n=1 Tax=Pseudomonas putida TaxID=303 RepID=UPI00301E04F0